MSVKAAERVKELVGELLDTRVADLADQGKTRSRIDDLIQSLDEIRSFATSLQSLLGVTPTAGRRPGRPPRAGRPAKSVAAAPKARRSGGQRGPGEFNATPFILEVVREAGARGVRPHEVVERVVTAVPGRHVRPSALVSTILSRLRRGGHVRRRAGKWYAA